MPTLSAWRLFSSDNLPEGTGVRVIRLPKEHDQPPRTVRNDTATWKEIRAIAVLGVLFTAVWSMLKGEYISWDQRNYHYYDAYAWLNNLVTYHIAPGQLQTWINPLIYIPHYFLIQHTSPVIAGTLFGALAGLNFVLIYALTRCVVEIERYSTEILVGLLAAVTGITVPQFLEEMGGSSSDSLVGIPVLAGLLVLCLSHRPGTKVSTKNLGYAVCGLLLGGAVGLKLTCAIYAVALTVTLVVLWKELQVSVRRFALYCGGGALGFLGTGGYWSWFLWSRYRNPIFPFYNTVFHSPLVAARTYKDTRFRLHNMTEVLLYPLQWFAGRWNMTGDNPFRDARYAMILVLLAITCLVGLWFKWRGSRGPHITEQLVRRQHFWLLIIFGIVSYLLWIKVFTIQRYLMPLGFLSGLLLLLLVDRLPMRGHYKVITFSVLALFSIGWTRPYRPERRPYGPDWFGVQLSPALSSPDTLVIMLGNSPMAYIVPFLPRSARVIHLSGNMWVEPETELGRQAADIVAAHEGPIRSVAASELERGDWYQLMRFGLILSESGCETFRSYTDHFVTCRLRREKDSHAPLFTITNATEPSRNPVFQVGDGWRLDVEDAAPGKSVYLRGWKDGASKGVSAPYPTPTDVHGHWSLSGIFDAHVVGTWREQVLIGDLNSKEISMVIEFVVNSRRRKELIPPPGRSARRVLPSAGFLRVHNE